jgi:hypothetical protein
VGIVITRNDGDGPARRDAGYGYRGRLGSAESATAAANHKNTPFLEAPAIIANGGVGDGGSGMIGKGKEQCNNNMFN